MSRWLILCSMLAPTLLLSACATASTSPVIPPTMVEDSLGVEPHSALSQTHLWGWYDVTIDIPGQTATATLNRQAMFTANVVNFINSKPAGLGFHINSTPIGPDYVDVDIDVTITHPFPGLPQYNGYDVRGVFMGDGTASLNYNPDLIYPVLGTDQYMLADPMDGFGGPDGYTRWFNKPEFTTGSVPLFSYTQGSMATPGFSGNATLCPYRYFADSLGKDADLWTWLGANGSAHGVFSSGATNTRNYYLRFPYAKGIKYGYAVIANWLSVEPWYHPSNAPEAIACSVVDQSTVYYISPTEKGGKLVFDISLYDWEPGPHQGFSQDYQIFVESSVLGSVHELDSTEMTPVGSGENYSTYHVEIAADNVLGAENNEYWIIAEEAGEDYANDFGVINLAGNDPLAACFRYNLTVGNQPGNTPPAITGITDDIPPNGLNTVVTASDTAVAYFALFNDPDPGQTHTFKWYIEASSATSPSDPPDSMPYNWAPKALGDYKIWVKVSDGFDEVTGGPYVVTRAGGGWALTWGGSEGDYGYGGAVDASGNVYVTGVFYGTSDLDPGPGEDWRTSNGNDDVFLSKFNPLGTLIWARTWGGSSTDESVGAAVDVSGNVYVIGYYQGYVDFNPGPETDWQTSNGYDIFLSKFDPSGTFLWAKTWGGSYTELATGVTVDSAGNAYAIGFFSGTVDFDPGPGVDNHTSTGSFADAFLSKFDPSGAFLWAKTWGGSNEDYSFGVAADIVENVYVGGIFSGTVDFDPGSGSDLHTSDGYSDAFLSKFGPSGTFIWAKTWGGSLADYGSCVAVDAAGNPHMIGWFEGTVDFDPGPDEDWHTSIGNDDAFLSRFDPSGAFVWARTWDASLPKLGSGLVVDMSGNIYVTGYFFAAVDFDPGGGEDWHNSNGSSDVFLSKFDSSGAFLWAKTWGGSQGEVSHDVVADIAGNAFVAGSFYVTADFDPGPGEDWHTSNGSSDAFLSKFLPDGSW